MQLVAERPSTGTIQAQMNYIVDTGTPPVRYIDWPEMEHKEILPQYKQHVMNIRDGRPLRDTFKLDTHASSLPIITLRCRTSPTRPSASASMTARWRN
jgi:hypothetical protein